MFTGNYVLWRFAFDLNWNATTLITYQSHDRGNLNGHLVMKSLRQVYIKTMPEARIMPLH